MPAPLVRPFACTRGAHCSAVATVVVLSLLVGSAQDRRPTPIPSISSSSTSQRRLALVVGNSAYTPVKLPNAANDAEDLSAALKETGFVVQMLLNATRPDIDRAVDAFVGSLAPGDVALFFYAGHGFQMDGENYLVPLDFDPKDAADARYQAYSASRLNDRIQGRRVGLTILILDACRDSPFGAARQAGGGWVAMNPSSGGDVYIMYATAPGRTASDNPSGRNGLFTAHLLAALRQPGLALNDIFTSVSAAVRAASNGRQDPWQSASGGAGTVRLRPPLAVGSSRATAIGGPPTQPVLGTRWTSPTDEAEMAWIPPGEFVMGSPRSEMGRDADEEQKRQTLNTGFWLDVAEVANRSFGRFLEENPVWRRDGRNPAPDSSALPVSGVDWAMASAYCAWAGKRLPTEVEWEYAARAGTKTAYWWGEGFDPLKANNSAVIAEIGTRARANAWGLIDMLGNVWEWTASSGTPANPLGPPQKIVRGGSVNANPSFLRSSNRSMVPADQISDRLGFRCAK